MRNTRAYTTRPADRMRRPEPLAYTRTVAAHASGLLPVEWPNGQLLHHRASPINGYDLCYSAWPGDPVTLFTARQGLRVDLGGGVRGTLDVPMRVYWGIARWGVEWRVATDAAVGYQYYLLRTHDSERLARDLVPGAGPPFSGTLEVRARRWRLLGSVRMRARRAYCEDSGNREVDVMHAPDNGGRTARSGCIRPGRPGGQGHAVHWCTGCSMSSAKAERIAAPAYGTCGIPELVTYSRLLQRLAGTLHTVCYFRCPCMSHALCGYSPGSTIAKQLQQAHCVRPFYPLSSLSQTVRVAATRRLPRGNGAVRQRQECGTPRGAVRTDEARGVGLVGSGSGSNSCAGGRQLCTA